MSEMRDKLRELRELRAYAEKLAKEFVEIDQLRVSLRLTLAYHCVSGMTKVYDKYDAKALRLARSLVATELEVIELEEELKQL